MSFDNYDPYLHRDVSSGLSYCAALVHILKGAIGTGILAMPDAFKNSGYVIGTLGLVGFAILITHCIHILLRSQYVICKMSKTSYMSYAESMQQALLMGPQWLRSCSNCSVHIVNWFLILAQTGTCCAYVTFVAESIRKILQVHLDFDMDVRIYMIILLVPFILLNLVKNLKYLAPFSLLANLFQLIGIIVVLYYLWKDGLSFDNRDAAGNVTRWPLFIGTAIFSMKIIGVVLPVEYKMNNPKSFRGNFGVMNVAMVIIALLYIIVGFTGYLKYGEYVRGSITLNLPQKKFLATSITILYIMAIFLSHALQAFSAIETLWDSYMKKCFTEGSKQYEIGEYVNRITFVTITVLLAIAIPQLALIISLNGAFCGSMLNVIFPAIMEICIRHNKDDFDKGNFIKNLFVINFGILAFIAGTYVAIRDMARK
ncbi:proton-coupled amino acid transporter-like protein CG1139 [Sergentomyia squamirostris]